MDPRVVRRQRAARIARFGFVLAQREILERELNAGECPARLNEADEVPPVRRRAEVR
jgi:hypothetical protein